MHTSLEVPRVSGRAHYTAVELQILDLELAHSFLDRAETTSDRDTVQRLHRKAREVFDLVAAFRGKLQPTPQQRAWIVDRLTGLEARLSDASQRGQDN